MNKETIEYFGYGSLVNLGSLGTPYISAQRATLKGWNRVWLSRPVTKDSFAVQEGLAFLSVVNTPNTEIDGMVITDHTSSLKSLDEREALYSRVTIAAEDIQHHDEPADTSQHFLYVADDAPAHKDARILRSYLDVVMQGYLQHFGVEGLDRFFATTVNFDLDIQEDRDDPLYPRATQLTSEEKKIFANYR